MKNYRNFLFLLVFYDFYENLKLCFIIFELFVEIYINFKIGVLFSIVFRLKVYFLVN